MRCIGSDAVSANQAAAGARGRLLLLLDPNLEADGGGWLREMVSHGLRPDVGVVGGKLLGPEGTVRHAGLALGGRDVVFYPFAGQQRTGIGYFGYLQLVRDVTAVSSACLLVRRDAFVACGGFDEALEVPAFKEIDLCLKLANAGYRTVWTPYAELRSRLDGSPLCAETAGFQRGIARMRRRWGARLENDPHWSPNLGLNSGETRLAFPPRAARKPASLGKGPSYCSAAGPARLEVIANAP